MLVSSKMRLLSSRGMPIMSQMICSGSAAAISATKSHSPIGATRSTISRAWTRTLSSILRDLTRREAAVDDQAQLRVLGRVHVDHRAEPLGDLGRDVGDVDARRGVERVGVARHLHHVGVARERPEARALRERASRAAGRARRGSVIGASARSLAKMPSRSGRIHMLGVAELDVVDRRGRWSGSVTVMRHTARALRVSDVRA